MTAMKVLIIGATGLLGKPVTNQLAESGFSIRVMARDRKRAVAQLPDNCELVLGDLRDKQSIIAALNGVDTVYLSLSNKMSIKKPEWDADIEGTLAVVECMKQTGVSRLLKLSAMGVSLDSDWWVAREKARIDDAVLASGLRATIFRPTWLMESIPTTAMGPVLMRLNTPSDPLYWLSADDMGRMVAAALRDDQSAGQIYELQGPEPASMKQAYELFAKVWKSQFWIAPLPRMMIKMMRPMVGPAAYLDQLLDMTYSYNVKQPAVTNGHELSVPRETITQFAEKLLKHGELPKKRM